MLTTTVVREGHGELPRALVVAFAVGSWLPLLLRRRRPGWALAGALAIEAVHVAVLTPSASELVLPAAMGFYQPAPIATMVGACAFAARSSRVRGWVAGLGSAAVLSLVGWAAQPDELLATDIVMANLVMIATGVGVGVASRRERLDRQDRDRRTEVHREVEGERLRIARDLHDGLAHHLTLVHAQAAVAEHLLATRPDRAADALRGISENARQALDEVRATVGLLRRDGEPDLGTSADVTPLPRLSDVDALVAGARAAGQDVTLVRRGTAGGLPAQTDVSAYRIVQQALTNAAQHAPGAAVEVVLDGGPDLLLLAVRNGPARRPVPARGRGGGHGVLGMRERATSCGGRLLVEQRPDGGFVVQAHLPLDRGGSASTATPAATADPADATNEETRPRW